MAAYVDDAAILYRGKPRFHLSADSLEEMHAFASAIGVNQCWFHRGTRHPHYDVTAEQRDRAISAGAIPVDQRTLLRVAKGMARPTRGEASPQLSLTTGQSE
ncbi:DUF4031 domain-containing protein [Paraburkholderia sp. UCT31]|uniref:DUF4031 domain-containing protein n=1 Tax=Paraburkholderia sp. UCT31 TaxID=2615209 RepID=UPI001655CD81|nr:DUF4031 domain-containing protein [Paraburkholderia sp. UCT31]MBC8741832.1 DUF4031 domain-containing protein [Paraburkholderia sp. UCT31]